jgi:hypothetical protein
MGLKEDLLRGIYSYGFEKPSAIQQRAIKPLILMRDTIAQAQSGTGKTATFTIGARHLRPTSHAQQPRSAAIAQATPGVSACGSTVGSDPHPRPPCSAGLLQNIDLNNRDCQALILAPTRELASQIVKVVMAIGDYLGVSTMVRTPPACPPPRHGSASRWLAPVLASAARVVPWRRCSPAPPSQGRDRAMRHRHAPTHARAQLIAPGQPRQPQAATHAGRAACDAGADEALTSVPLCTAGLHWWHERAPGHGQAALRRPACRWHAGPRV